MSEPASIKYNNPGAMWGGSHANKWGATATKSLNDGLGQGNTIAIFPSVIQGGAAQFDLWRKAYTGMSLKDAVKRWSGGNSSPAYVNFLEKHADIGADEIVSIGLLSSSRGIALMQAQAWWEAGKPYPMTDAQWQAAQRLVFGTNVGVPPPPDIPKPETNPSPPPQGGFFVAVLNIILSIFKRN